MPENNKPTRALLGEAQAALWLTESLILALLEANLLDADAILEAIDIVIAAKRTKIAEGGEYEEAHAALTQLASIGASIAAAKVGSAADAGEPRDRSRQKRST